MSTELGAQVDAFRAELSEVKSRYADFPWYPHSSVNNFPLIDATIPGGWLPFQERLKGSKIADIGAADGETSFFLERFGVSVDIIDNPATNFNNLKGAYALKEALASTVNIYEIDLDQRCSLPSTYDFVLLLGILYHLKNPFYILESLARSAKSIIISTKVCTHDKIGGTFIKDIPAAYLVDTYEANNDSTNFWMFTHAGLKRILHRAGWDIRAFKTFGSVDSSDPYSGENDERAYVYAEAAPGRVIDVNQRRAEKQAQRFRQPALS